MIKEQKKRPNFFIVGVPRAGTTSLYEYLKDIPGIYMSPVKEPNYFAIIIVPDNFHFKPIRNEKEYLSLFEGVKDERIIGEASANYLADPEAPKLIHEISPNAKILISLRDPIERLFSHYLMYVKSGLTKLSFDDAIGKELNGGIDPSKPKIQLDTGLYFKNVKTYLDIFGSKQVKILIFEEFVQQPKKAVQEILEFLNIKSDLDNFSGEAHNVFASPRGAIARYLLSTESIRPIARALLPSSSRKYFREKILIGKPSKPSITRNSHDILFNYYREDVKKLENLLGRKFPWKNF